MINLARQRALGIETNYMFRGKVPLTYAVQDEKPLGH